MSEYITTSALCKKLDVSRSTFFAHTRNMPGFPEPRKWSPKCVRWKVAEVEAWADAQKQTRAA